LEDNALVILEVISRDLESKLGLDFNVYDGLRIKTEKDLEEGEDTFEVAVKKEAELEVNEVVDLAEPRSAAAVDTGIIFAVDTEEDVVYADQSSATSVHIDAGVKRGRSAQESVGAFPQLLLWPGFDRGQNDNEAIDRCS
jgi:hypothetical protein